MQFPVTALMKSSWIALWQVPATELVQKLWWDALSCSSLSLVLTVMLIGDPFLPPRIYIYSLFGMNPTVLTIFCLSPSQGFFFTLWRGNRVSIAWSGSAHALWNVHARCWKPVQLSFFKTDLRKNRVSPLIPWMFSFPLEPLLVILPSQNNFSLIKAVSM